MRPSTENNKEYMMENDEFDLIEGAEAAAGILGLSKRQVYHMVAKKRLPHTRIGNRLYFRKSELRKRFTANDNTTNFNMPAAWSDIIEGVIRHA